MLRPPALTAKAGARLEDVAEGLWLPHQRPPWLDPGPAHLSSAACCPLLAARGSAKALWGQASGCSRSWALCPQTHLGNGGTFGAGATWEAQRSGWVSTVEGQQQIQSPLCLRPTWRGGARGCVLACTCLVVATRTAWGWTVHPTCAKPPLAKQKHSPHSTRVSVNRAVAGPLGRRSWSSGHWFQACGS